MQDTTLLLSLNNLPPFSVAEKEANYNSWVDTVVASSDGIAINHKKYDGTITQPSSPAWIIILLLVGFSCIAVSRSVYRKRFIMLYKTLGNWKLSKQIIRYEKVYTHPVNILMTLNFVIIIPLFFSLVYSKLFNPLVLLEQQYILVLGPLVIYLLAKTALYQFSGWLWNEKPVIEEYLFQSNLFNKYTGVAFLILASLVVYSPIAPIVLAKIGLTTLALLALFQIIRGVMIGLENGMHLFFIIAYLCTLEILPWFVVGKWITGSL